MEEKIKELRAAIEQASADVTDKARLSDFWQKYLSKNGEVAGLTKSLRDVPKEDRPAVGKTINEFKQWAEAQYQALSEQVEKAALEARNAAETVDITMPAKIRQTGSLHPITLVKNEIIDVFAGMGFEIYEGPEIEDDDHNFTRLNVPKNHPARDMQDTYYLDNGQLLKTHTSAAQNTIMKKYGAPLRAIFPGRCFRNESTDASHENTFFQMEGIMIDKDISISNLIYFMKTMLSKVFKQDVQVRLRPGFFPFVEPGFELDISCHICGGKGCSTCHGSGWIELCPCGMIHPNVLRAGGIDPDEYTGFAFGLGLTRLAMMRYGIKDIRDLNSGNLKVLSQFNHE